MDVYRHALDDPAAVEAVCEDYRAGRAIDASHSVAEDKPQETAEALLTYP